MKAQTVVQLIAVVLLLAIGLECYADDAAMCLKNGLKAYREADFDGAVSELQKAVQLGLDDRAEMIQARLHLGFAYIGRGEKAAAEIEFAKAIKLDPTLNLDSKLHSTKIITTFNKMREHLVDSLTVISVPGGAEVYLDSAGISAGVTPLKLGSILIGEHTLRIVKEYFKPGVVNIRVEKGKNNRVQVQLDQAEVELQITSQPSEAAVYVADETEPHGITPVSLKAFLGQELAVKLAKEEFINKELKIKLTEAGVVVSGAKGVIPLESGVGVVHVELAPAPPPGSLRITSDPTGAAVRLDGVELGNTPLTIARVTPGIRKLQIGMPGFTSVTEIVEVVGAGETAVDIALGGRLNILSIPTSAQVFIDAEYAGMTPFRTGRIPAGSHQLRLAKEKHKDEFSAAIVEKGQEKEINIRLLPVKGSIAVSSEPTGAAVYLDGESKGNTPLFIYGVMVGRHSLKLAKSGYENREKQITVEELKVLWQFMKLKTN